jgi:hypothetical protein
MNTPSEQEFRQLRDRIYKTEPRWGTDAGWEAVRRNWMKPENIAWLRAQPQNRVIENAVAKS